MKAIKAPTTYPVELFISNVDSETNRIVAFILLVFKTMQNCNDTYKGFIKIISWI